jgi:hypothetical protein
MPSKKKPRPLFEVPVEIGSRLESGWVYRSGVSRIEPAPAPVEVMDSPGEHNFVAAPGVRESGAGVTQECARTVGMALATVAETFVLAAKIAVLPIRIGFRTFQRLVRPDPSH